MLRRHAFVPMIILIGESHLKALLKLIIFILLAVNTSMAESSINLRESERIVFFGDSLTAGGAGPVGWVTLVSEALKKKHPQKKLEFINAGISGDTIQDLLDRFEEDILGENPTLIVLYIGINDIWRNSSSETFQKDFKELLEKIASTDSRLLVCTVSVIGENITGEREVDVRLDKAAEIQRQLASEKNIPICDLRKAFVDYLKFNNKTNRSYGILTNDEVHLNQEGQRLVSESVLKVIK